MHGLAHGLGIFDNFDVSGAGVGTAGANGGSPVIYDRFVVDGSGASLLNTAAYPNPSAALGSRLTAGPLRWSGAAGTAANAGQRPVLYAPGAWEPGSSVSHLDEATYPEGDPDALMTPRIFSGEVAYSVGPILPAMLVDEGWVLDPVTTTSF